MEVFAGHLQPIHHPWIPAFAGMTNWGAILWEPPIPDWSPGHAFLPTLGKCVDPGPTRHIQFPRPPLSLVLSPHGRRYGYGQARNRVSL